MAYLAIVLVALLGLALYVMLRPRTMISVKSSITGKEYTVRRGPEAQLTADRLASLEIRLRKLLDGAAARMPDDPRIVAIRRKWDGTLSEVEAADEVAFSVDKTSIHVCLRDPNGRMEDLNTSMFVLIHELAHVATHDYGHSPEFWANMRFLLELAEQLGVYSYDNYAGRDATFCGHPLGVSPLTCVKNRSCESTLGTR